MSSSFIFLIYHVPKQDGVSWPIMIQSYSGCNDTDTEPNCLPVMMSRAACMRGVVGLKPKMGAMPDIDIKNKKQQLPNQSKTM